MQWLLFTDKNLHHNVFVLAKCRQINNVYKAQQTGTLRSECRHACIFNTDHMQPVPECHTSTLVSTRYLQYPKSFPSPIPETIMNLSQKFSKSINQRPQMICPSETLCTMHHTYAQAAFYSTILAGSYPTDKQQLQCTINNTICYFLILWYRWVRFHLWVHTVK